MLAIERKSVRDGALLGIAVYLIALAVAVLHEQLSHAIGNPDILFVVAAIHDGVRFLGLGGIFACALVGALIGRVPIRRAFRGNVPPETYWN